MICYELTGILPEMNNVVIKHIEESSQFCIVSISWSDSFKYESASNITFVLTISTENASNMIVNAQDYAYYFVVSKNSSVSGVYVKMCIHCRCSENVYMASDLGKHIHSPC